MSKQSNSSSEAARAAKSAAYTFRYGVAIGITVAAEQAENAASVILPDNHPEIVRHNGGRFVFFGALRTADKTVMTDRIAAIFKAAADLEEYNKQFPQGQIFFSRALGFPPLSEHSGAASLVGPVKKTPTGFEVEACLTSGLPPTTKPKDGKKVFSTPKYKLVKIVTDAEGDITAVIVTNYGCYFRQVDGVAGLVPMIEPVRLQKPFFKKWNATDADKARFERDIRKYEAGMLEFPDGLIVKTYEAADNEDAEATFFKAHSRFDGDRPQWFFDKAVWDQACRDLDAAVENSKPKMTPANFLAGQTKDSLRVSIGAQLKAKEAKLAGASK